MARRWLGVLALLAALGSCKARSSRRPMDPPGAALAAATSPSAAPAPTVLASALGPAPSVSAASAAAAKSGGPVAPPAPPGPPQDACHLTRGPIQLSFTGPVTLVADAGDGDPRIVFNRDGAPHAVILPAAAKKPDAPTKGAKPAAAPKPERLVLGEPAERATSPACAAAGSSIFCLDKAGAIHRSSLAGEGSVVVAQARPGSPIAAATIAGSHLVYAFLADRKTSEGALTLAFAGLDDATPVLLSEEGSGATYVMLAPRGEEALAMYIDARRVLTPVHARVLTAAGKLALGADAVVFVGSGTDGRTPCAIAQGSHGHALALLPIDKDDKACGMAAIRIEDQPRDDAPVTWSLYPATLERPAIAATRGAWPIRVLRTRPVDTDTKGKKVLELGELDAAGVWKELCPVAQGSAFADPAMVVDRSGALWIAYSDGDGTWVERRGK